MTAFESRAPLLPEILALHGRWRAGKDAVLCDGERLDWAAFTAANHRIAHGLIDAGIEPGDRVGVVMSNGLPMLHTLCGVMAAGAVCVPVNLSVSDDAMLSMLADAEIAALVTTDDQRQRLESRADELPKSLRLPLASSTRPSGGLRLT